MPMPLESEDAGIYSVSQVAEMLNVQQPFLRRLDSFSIVSPQRSDGRQRRYSRNDVRLIQHSLSLIGEGLTLAGLRRVLELEAEVRALKADISALKARRVVFEDALP